MVDLSKHASAPLAGATLREHTSVLLHPVYMMLISYQVRFQLSRTRTPFTMSHFQRADTQNVAELTQNVHPRPANTLIIARKPRSSSHNAFRGRQVRRTSALDPAPGTPTRSVHTISQAGPRPAHASGASGTSTQHTSRAHSRVANVLRVVRRRQHGPAARLPPLPPSGIVSGGSKPTTARSHAPGRIHPRSFAAIRAEKICLILGDFIGDAGDDDKGARVPVAPLVRLPCNFVDTLLWTFRSVSCCVRPHPARWRLDLDGGQIDLPSASTSQPRLHQLPSPVQTRQRLFWECLHRSNAATAPPTRAERPRQSSWSPPARTPPPSSRAGIASRPQTNAAARSPAPRSVPAPDLSTVRRGRNRATAGDFMGDLTHDITQIRVPPAFRIRRPRNSAEALPRTSRIARRRLQACPTRSPLAARRSTPLARRPATPPARASTSRNAGVALGHRGRGLYDAAAMPAHADRPRRGMWPPPAPDSAPARASASCPGRTETAPRTPMQQGASPRGVSGRYAKIENRAFGAIPWALARRERQKCASAHKHASSRGGIRQKHSRALPASSCTAYGCVGRVVPRRDAGDRVVERIKTPRRGPLSPARDELLGVMHSAQVVHSEQVVCMLRRRRSRALVA